MRVYLRNFPEIKKERFTDEDAYQNAIRRQNKQIQSYVKKVRKVFFVSGAVIALILVILICFAGGKLIKGLFNDSTEFSVEDTVLNTRNVKLDKEKIYEKEPVVVEEPLVICIDPGHGGEELGETLENEEGEIIRSEKIDNMKLALLLQEKLEDYDVTVIMTRTGDTKHTNDERCTFANENSADLFVSLHRNNDKNDTTRKGVEIYTPTDKNEFSEDAFITGEYIMQYLNASGISYNGGTHKGSITSEVHDFQVNRETEMASILLEIGYISNDEDNVLYDLNIERYATAIAYGILKHYAPECIEFDSMPVGEIQNNTLIFNYENLNEDSISYSINPDEKDNFNNYLYFINQYDELYGSSSAEFIRQNENNEIYLTFDVGSDAGNTAEILDILKKSKVKAVFFVNYTFAVNHPDLINAMIDDGHIIGNGSKDYPDSGLPSLEESEQLNQIIQLHEYVLYNYNYCMSLFRFPNGIYSEKLLAIVNNYHYNSIFWSYSYNDYTNLGFERSDILRSMYRALNSGVIFSLRTDSEPDLSVLDEFIDGAIDSGFVFGELKYSE